MGPVAYRVIIADENHLELSSFDIQLSANLLETARIVRLELYLRKSDPAARDETLEAKSMDKLQIHHHDQAAQLEAKLARFYHSSSCSVVHIPAMRICRLNGQTCIYLPLVPVHEPEKRRSLFPHDATYMFAAPANSTGMAVVGDNFFFSSDSGLVAVRTICGAELPSWPVKCKGFKLVGALESSDKSSDAARLLFTEQAKPHELTCICIQTQRKSLVPSAIVFTTFGPHCAFVREGLELTFFTFVQSSYRRLAMFCLDFEASCEALAVWRGGQRVCVASKLNDQPYQLRLFQPFQLGLQQLAEVRLNLADKTPIVSLQKREPYIVLLQASSLATVFTEQLVQMRSERLLPPGSRPVASAVYCGERLSLLTCDEKNGANGFVHVRLDPALVC